MKKNKNPLFGLPEGEKKKNTVPSFGGVPMAIGIRWGLLIIILSSCGTNPVTESDEEVETTTPVTIINISHETLTETVELNATSSFLLKTNVKVNANGYLEKANVKLGDFVSKGDELFELKTKEAMSLDNTVNRLDSSFHFKGVISIKATGSGYITSIDHKAGDYVQDGEQVATISDVNSFVFLLDLPYELTALLPKNNSLELKLPDGTILNGKIEKAMPSADAVSQTQTYVIQVSTQKMIPENLIAKVLLIKNSKTNAASLPKEAVLSNETQTEFWIMKLINDSTAIKVSVKKGIETTDKVEVLEPAFNEKEKIVLSGNYGLSDTAKVFIQQIGNE